ncbi:hypothetical protein CDAR_573851 [Caerostris darwini]|uniref:Uncharacterized protein n=1 Tax=Caerostris darwini TaxID=1538125 RepID=A0AAV4MEE1_9ARAC|nr:hypothetical protein CDAR_573851 [Caerostris darwini]
MTAAHVITQIRIGLEPYHTLAAQVITPFCWSYEKTLKFQIGRSTVCVRGHHNMSNLLFKNRSCCKKYPNLSPTILYLSTLLLHFAGRMRKRCKFQIGNFTVCIRGNRNMSNLVFKNRSCCKKCPNLRPTIR